MSQNNKHRQPILPKEAEALGVILNGNDNIFDSKPPATTAEEAVAILQAEANKRMEAYNVGLVRLTEQTGYAVAPALELPGGELVLLSSWLTALGIKANPRLKIVPK